MSCRASWASAGASARHGAHQEPQKFRTTTCPWYGGQGEPAAGQRRPGDRGAAGPAAAAVEGGAGAAGDEALAVAAGRCSRSPRCRRRRAQRAGTQRASARPAARARGRRGSGRGRMPPWRGHRGKRDRVISYRQ